MRAAGCSTGSVSGTREQRSGTSTTSPARQRSHDRRGSRTAPGRSRTRRSRRVGRGSPVRRSTGANEGRVPESSRREAGGAGPESLREGGDLRRREGEDAASSYTVPIFGWARLSAREQRIGRRVPPALRAEDVVLANSRRVRPDCRPRACASPNTRRRRRGNQSRSRRPSGAEDSGVVGSAPRPAPPVAARDARSPPMADGWRSGAPSADERPRYGVRRRPRRVLPIAARGGAGAAESRSFSTREPPPTTNVRSLYAVSPNDGRKWQVEPRISLIHRPARRQSPGGLVLFPVALERRASGGQPRLPRPALMPGCQPLRRARRCR